MHNSLFAVHIIYSKIYGKGALTVSRTNWEINMQIF